MIKKENQISKTLPSIVEEDRKIHDRSLGNDNECHPGGKKMSHADTHAFGIGGYCVTGVCGFFEAAPVLTCFVRISAYAVLYSTGTCSTI